MIDLPISFLENMKALLGEDYPDYIACLEEPRYYGLRVNTRKLSVSDFEKISPFQMVKIPWIDNGFYYNGEVDNPSKHPFYYAGLYYLQEPSAMTPASRLPIVEGDKVLDLCAAPGGKATELGAKLKDTGLLVANDISPSRTKALLKNIELSGIDNVLVLSEEPGHIKDRFLQYFDKILIDAPCSGEGMFRKDQRMAREWEKQNVASFFDIQKQLVLEGTMMLKPDGYLLYSTCTFNQTENEDVISYLLEACGDMEIIDMNNDYEGFSKGFAPLSKSRRIFPYRMKGEGHFLALLHKKKTVTNIAPKKNSQKPINLPIELLSFLQHVKKSFNKERFMIRNERIYYLPTDCPNLQGLRLLRSGLLIGEYKKNRFEPSQAFAMHLKKEEYEFTLNLKIEDENVIKYLRGDTLMIPGLKEREHYLVCLEGFPLGFGKYVNGMLKNKYAKGWRLM